MEANNNVFLTASKKKYRFTYHGSITVEDLWDLPDSALDIIYKDLNRQVRSKAEESLLDTDTVDPVLLDKLEIVKTIYLTKKADKEARLAEREKAERKQRILALISEKQDASLKEKSEEELRKMLEEI